MNSKLILLCAVCFTCAGTVYAKPDSAKRSFKTMMGDRGAWLWNTYSKKALWKIRAVKNNAQKPMEQYAQSIQYLHHLPINTIPKTIHFIWIGPEPFPQKSIGNLLSWKNHHPNWEIFLWTDRADRKLPIEGMKRRLLSESDFGPCQPLIDESDNWSEKSDILRLAIVYKEGGIYTDHDVECTRPFDPLASHYDFVAGYEPMHPYVYSMNTPFIPNNGLIVSRPHHPILEMALERLCSRWHTFDNKFPGTDKDSVVSRVLSRTFDPFAYCASNLVNSDEYRNIILPACYFHSSNCFTKKTMRTLTKQGHVYAIHRFDASWLPKEGPTKRA